ncbi:MAG TPA: hypothetical protein VL359_11445 [bacterium]|nr:hypothetical protein [bacterium]
MESPYFNSLLHYVSAEQRFNSELAPAKEEFERIAGPIYETDRSFDARINAFHNWYILDRPLRGGKTPLGYFLEYNANSLPPDEWQRYQELLHHMHSVFELARVSGEDTVLRNLLTGKKLVLPGGEQTAHLDKNAVFSTRIFDHAGTLYFSNYLLLHPGQVRKIIKDQARRLRKAKADATPFLHQLLLFHSRWDQYKQMDLRSIYRFPE